MLASQFHIYLPWINTCLAYYLNSALNVDALVGTFNQEEKALVGTFSVIVKTLWTSVSSSTQQP